MSEYSREELLYLARLAEQCDRFDGKSTSKSLLSLFLQRCSTTLLALVERARTSS